MPRREYAFKSTSGVSQNSRPIRRKKKKPKKPSSQEVRALREIRRSQQQTNNLVPAFSFQCLVRQIVNDQFGTDKDRKSRYRWQSRALAALQIAAEMFLIGVLEESYQFTIHAKRVTLQKKDIDLSNRIRGRGELRTVPIIPA